MYIDVRWRLSRARFSASDGLDRVQREVGLAFPDACDGASPPALELHTAKGERAAVDSDLALRVVAGVPSSAGELVAVSPIHAPPTLSVSALLEALAQPRSPSPSPPPSQRARTPTPPPPSPPRTRTPTPPPMHRQGRARGGTGTSTGELREHMVAEYAFRTHWNVGCSICRSGPITGARYATGSLSFCERCRRARDPITSCTVYEHPWESTMEYTSYTDASELRAPAAPLEPGSFGPRVVHLHFALYTLGYLALLAPGFRADAYNAVTRDAVAAFQDAFVPEDGRVRGVYTLRTRVELLARIGLHARVDWRRERHDGVRLRSALAA